MRVLVTGAAGFIGHHACREFLDSGHDVVGIDTDGRAGDFRRLEENGCADHPRFKLFVWDLRKPIPGALATGLGHIQCIVNLASDSHVDNSIADPAPFVSNNIGVMLTMLEYARHLSSLQSFWQVSTDEVYGPSGPGTIHSLPCDTNDRHSPSNPYAASKAAQENLCHAWRKTYGVPIGIVNAMNNFGERQNNEKFIPKAISLLRQSRPVPVHARHMFVSAVNDTKWVAGSRGWLHVDDFALALRLLAERIPSRELTDYEQQQYHVPGEELTNIEVVQEIADVMGVKPIIQLVDAHTARPGHDFSYSLDGVEMCRVGWKPRRSLEERFRQVVEWATPENLEKWK